jgi:hypothetical protein
MGRKEGEKNQKAREDFVEFYRFLRIFVKSLFFLTVSWDFFLFFIVIPLRKKGSRRTPGKKKKRQRKEKFPLSFRLLLSLNAL